MQHLAAGQVILKGSVVMATGAAAEREQTLSFTYHERIALFDSVEQVPVSSQIFELG